MLKVLVNCPGGWSHGLDSPERGEGRWAQNLVRCLAKSGKYAVSACSGGIPTWGRGDKVGNVKILSESAAAEFGPYDLYFDASWYDKKKPAARATYNFHVHFGFEPRLEIPLPENHYLVYVLRGSKENYFKEACRNADRTIYLPAPFGETLQVPDPSRRRVIHTMRGSDAPGRLNRFEMLYEVVSRLRQAQETPFTWISSVGLEDPRHAQDRVLSMDKAWGIPYNELRAELRGCGLNAALDGWSNTLDSMALGVPSLMWVGGVDATAHDVARHYDMLLDPATTDVARLYDVVSRLYGNAETYTGYTKGIQDVFQDHVEPVTLSFFDALVSRVMG